MHSRLTQATAAALAGVAGWLAASSAQAQIVPRAGQILEQIREPVEPLSSPTELRVQPAATQPLPAPGGPQLVVQRLLLEGMTRFDEATLLAALGEYRGKAFDLAGLRGLAEQITRFYHEHGYPFALAYLPPQTTQEGTLLIRIIEGRYGEVRVTGDASLREGAEGFLSTLKPGAVIEGASLERAIHLLGDQPGIEISPVLMPGTKVGSGDLEVQAEEGRRFAGDVAIDNQGNRYTGAWRVSSSLDINRVLTFGDQLTFGAMLTDEQLWYGRLGYALPLGHSGLRARAEYLHTDYELGADFSSLGATGDMRSAKVGVQYPWVRSLRSNLVLTLDLDHKLLSDRPSDASPADDKTSTVLPLSMQFDYRDNLGGEGLSWGVLTWTPGRLRLDRDLRLVDGLTARSEGDFSRWNLELARVQQLPGAFSLFARLAGQWSDDNLDSSEDFGLGGPNGVRAYPRGEGFGDRGWLGQAELRYQRGVYAPFLFFDAGEITLNADPWAPGTNERYLAGGGLGLRIASGGWTIDGTAAWRWQGGRPLSDTRDQRPRLWISARYRF